MLRIIRRIFPLSARLACEIHTARLEARKRFLLFYVSLDGGEEGKGLLAHDSPPHENITY
jgi:hypothetical protein